MKFSELVRTLETNGFRMIREKGSVRYYAKPGLDKLVRIDYHGSREMPIGTCNERIKKSYLNTKMINYLQIWSRMCKCLIIITGLKPSIKA